MIENKEITNFTLEDLGFSDFFALSRDQLGLADSKVARVIAQHKGSYKVKNENGEYFAKITGKQIFNASTKEDYPAVGDWVTITELDKQQVVIHKVLLRRTQIKRKYSGNNEIQIIAVNVDVVFIIESVGRDYNLNRLERYLSIARNEGIEPAIILNKTDLVAKEEYDLMLAQIKNRFADVVLIPTSTVNEQGLEELKNYLKKGKTYCFLGSSGVGKSSLINKLLGNDSIKTSNVNLSSGRGKHTTTNREMYFLPNGSIVIDNPGVREIGMTETIKGINEQFDELSVLGLKCKYNGCSHTHEPGCEVVRAVSSNNLDKDKYNNYLNLKKEAEFYKLTKLEKKEKNRKFGKFVKKVKDELKARGHKGYL